MRVQDLLWGKGPKLHQSAGVPHSWQVSDDVLQFIDGHVTQETSTLETGAGVTTVLFAISGSKHTCIVPFVDEVDRIKAFCAEHGISLANVTFVIERSEFALPRLDPGQLDLVLIDGAHGFPSPLIDWYFTADRLRVGGYLVLDDTWLWSVNVLKQFLMQEPEWRLYRDMWPRSAIFSKVGDASSAKNEFAQPFVVTQTVNLLFPDNIHLIRPFVSPGLLESALETLRHQIDDGS